MTRVLFLDDNYDRIKAFRRRYEHEFDITVVMTAQECIHELQKSHFEVVFLDHDLGGEEWVDSTREDTGMGVVRWIEEHRPEVGEFIVHSHNPPAANNMKVALDRARYQVRAIPFRLLVQSYRGV